MNILLSSTTYKEQNIETKYKWSIPVPSRGHGGESELSDTHSVHYLSGKADAAHEPYQIIPNKTSYCGKDFQQKNDLKDPPRATMEQFRLQQNCLNGPVKARPKSN